MKETIIFANQKGGVWKTSTAISVCDIAIQSGLALDIYSVDIQSRMNDLFVSTKTIVVPNSEAVAADDIADARAFAPIFNAMLNTEPETVIVDIGANNLARFCKVGISVGIADEMKNCPARAIIVIPTTPDPAAISAAIDSAEALIATFQESARYVLAECGNGFAAIANDSNYLKLRHICAEEMKVPSLGTTTLRRFEQSKRLGSAFASMTNTELAAALNENKIEAAFTARNIMTYLAKMIDESERVFRFQISKPG